jgi:TPR repeat protein
MYYKGQGIEQDHQKAFYWYREAEDNQRIQVNKKNREH